MKRAAAVGPMLRVVVDGDGDEHARVRLARATCHAHYACPGRPQGCFAGFRFKSGGGGVLCCSA